MLTGQNVWRAAVRNLWNSARQGRNGRRLRLRRDRGAFSTAGMAAEVLEVRQLLTAGAIDTTFGNGGTTAPGAGPVSAMQTNGQSVTAGVADFAFKYKKDSYTGSDLVVNRYTTAGVLDTSFGGTGTVSVSLGSQAAVEAVYAMQMQSNGQILVAAAVAPNVTSSTTASETVVVRLNANGTLDTSFGKNGIFTYDTSSALLGMTVDPQGRIILVDQTYNLVPAPSGTPTQLIRLTANGALDSSFGTGGVVNSTIGTNGNNSTIPKNSNDSILLQSAPSDPNGYKIVVGAAVLTTSSPLEWEGELVRFNSNGTLDTSFGTGGTTVFESPLAPSQAAAGDVYHGTRVSQIALEADGSIVVAGAVYGYAGSSLFLSPYAAHFSANGVVDPSFGNSGYAVLNATGEGFSDVQIDASGNIVAVGAFSGQTDLVRFTATGQLDTTFGAGQGFVSFGNTSLFAGLWIDPNGNIVVDASNSNGQVLYRFLGS